MSGNKEARIEALEKEILRLRDKVSYLEGRVNQLNLIGISDHTNPFPNTPNVPWPNPLVTWRNTCAVGGATNCVVHQIQV